MLCKFCGEQMVFVSDSTDGPGWESVDTSYYECSNPACEGENEKQCDWCDNYAWMTGEDRLSVVHHNDVDHTICFGCVESLNEEIAA